MKTWKKCASVTSGGKPHFWFKNGAARQWIVWNRALRQWEHTQEMLDGSSFVVATALSDKALLKGEK